MKSNLKWKFYVQYKDGEAYTQPDDDVSCRDPFLSSFSDVIRDQIKSFSLTNDLDFFTVDLETGLFSTNAGEFKLHEGELHDFELIYIRRVTLKVRFASIEEFIENQITYILGFKAVNSKGETVKHCLSII
jgi:hypothetical protein